MGNYRIYGDMTLLKTNGILLKNFISKIGILFLLESAQIQLFYFYKRIPKITKIR